MTDLNAMRFAYAQSNAQLKSKQEELRTLNARVAGMQRREQELQAYKKTLQDDLARCSNIDIPQTREEIKLLAQREIDVTSNIVLITGMLKTCNSNLNVAKRTWASLSNENAKIKAENDAMERAIYLCKVDVEALREQITTHKADVGKYGSLYQACLAELNTLTAKNEGMAKMVKDLTAERDEWLRRCSGQQRNFFDDNAKVVAQYTQVGVKLGNDLCGSADPLAAEIAKMVRVRDSLIRSMTEMQQPSCSQTFVRACCR